MTYIINVMGNIKTNVSVIFLPVTDSAGKNGRNNVLSSTAIAFAGAIPYAAAESDDKYY